MPPATLPSSPLYRRGVSFDTFDAEDAPFKLFTLSFAHGGYYDIATATTTARPGRVFLCGLDGTESSDLVLRWALGELVDDGDEIVCVYGVEKESILTGWPSRSKRGRHHRIEAEKLLESVINKNTSGKVIKIVLEIVGVGKSSSIVVQSIIDLYEPTALVVAASDGNSSSVQKMLSGSVSTCCWQQPEIPVIVVRAGMMARRPHKSNHHHQQQQQQDQGQRRLSDQRSSISHRSSSPRDNGSLSTQDFLTTTKGGTTKAGGCQTPQKRGILKNKHEKLFIKQSDSDKCDADTNETLGEQGFTLPIGFLSTESGPQADLAMKSPSIAALEEDWEDEEKEQDKNKGKKQQQQQLKVQNEEEKDDDDDPAVSDDTDDDLKPMKILAERRPSVRETTPWLASILGPTRTNPRGHNRKSQIHH
ncbi:hypothetical protein H2204_007145 [Knufia peltigerae]|uniref:UspA domain-containing protein n=1 Tax=Knufia peltigerae TaxID=1002370 RepID=A0AA38Y278_9EURO|nr:hypothetical protein H2204_007145 [Knufia peltigerae]